MCVLQQNALDVRRYTAQQGSQPLDPSPSGAAAFEVCSLSVMLCCLALLTTTCSPSIIFCAASWSGHLTMLLSTSSMVKLAMSTLLPTSMTSLT